MSPFKGQTGLKRILNASGYSLDGLRAAFTGEAAGIWGAIRPVEQLQHIFGYRNAHIFPDRVFIPGVGNKLDENGRLTDASIDERLKKQATRFAKFVKTLSV